MTVPTTRDAGERVISTEAVIDWVSDGSTITLTAPVQDATVTLIDESGIGISRVFSERRHGCDVITESGPDTPATLEVKLTSYISRNLEKVGLNPAGYFDADTYYLDVDISGLKCRMPQTKRSRRWPVSLCSRRIRISTSIPWLAS